MRRTATEVQHQPAIPATFGNDVKQGPIQWEFGEIVTELLCVVIGDRRVRRLDDLGIEAVARHTISLARRADDRRLSW